MPISQTCTSDELLAALRAHQETIGQIVLDARPKITQLKTIASKMDSSVLTPMEDTLNQIFSQINMNVADLKKLGGFQEGATREELEKSLTDMGLSVVNGRILVTRNGDTDLTNVKELHRLVGSFQGIQRLVPEVFPCFDNGDMLAGSTPITSRFLVIITHQKTEIIPGEGCKPDTTTTTETVLGIEKPIAQVLYEHPELTRADLTVYVFWIGKPAPSLAMKAKAAQYGLTDDEYLDAMLRKSAPSYKVKVIDKPYEQLCVFSNSFGDDADAIVSRGFGGGGNARPPRIKMNPTAQEVMDEVRRSGIMTARPGRVNSKGLPDYGSPVMQALSVIDFEKSFGSKDLTPCVDVSLNLSEVGAALGDAMSAVSNAMNSLISEIISGFMGVLNKITGIFSTIDAFLLKLLQCLFPPGAGSGGLDLNSGPLGKLVGLLQGGLDLFQNFFDLLADLLTILAPLACIKAALADLGKSFTSAIPGLACVLSTFSFDFCFNVRMDIGRMEADLGFQMLSGALANLRLMLQILFTFALNFPSDFEVSMCLPADTAILMVKLGLRAALANAGVPL